MTGPSFIRLNTLDRLERPAARYQRVFVSRLRGVEGEATCHGFGIKAVLEGQETYRIDGTVRLVEAGEFMIVSPGEHYAVGIGAQKTAVGLCIDVPAARIQRHRHKAGSGPTGAPTAVFSLRDSALGSDVLRVWRRIKGPAPRPVASLEPRLAEWLADHDRASARLDVRRASTRRELYARVERARRYLVEHADRPVSLDELARAAHLSAYHLNRAFRCVHQEPPGRFHRRLRLMNAADLLRRHAATASELADALGYADLSAFSRAFRRVHGVTPTQVRRSSKPEKRARSANRPWSVG